MGFSLEIHAVERDYMNRFVDIVGVNGVAHTMMIEGIRL